MLSILYKLFLAVQYGNCLKYIPTGHWHAARALPMLIGMLLDGN